MSANTSLAQRIGRVLERVTRQSGRLPETPAYGSLLLGRVAESQGRRRVRIQIIMTVMVLGANLIGVAVGLLLVTVAIPVPSVFDDAPAWITFGAAPAYIVAASAWGTYWITRRTVIALRWAIEGRTPTPEDERNTFVAPWRIALVDLVLWGIGTVLLTTLYGLVNSQFIPRFLLVVSFCGVVVATASYLLAEFALRPVAAQALEAGPPPRRFSGGLMGRTMVVWFLGSAVPVIGIMMLAFFELADAQSDRDPVRGRRTDRVDGHVDLRLRPDVDPGLAHRDTGAGGAGRATARRTGRSARRPRGVRRHRTR